MWFGSHAANKANPIKDIEKAIARVQSEKVSVSWARVRSWLALDSTPSPPGGGQQRNWKLDAHVTELVRSGRMVTPQETVSAPDIIGWWLVY